MCACGKRTRGVFEDKTKGEGRRPSLNYAKRCSGEGGGRFRKKKGEKSMESRTGRRVGIRYGKEIGAEGLGWRHFRK